MGILQVTRAAYPDPTSTDPQWLTCDLRPIQSLPRLVTLAELKANPSFTDLPLIRQPRLSVMPMSEEHFSAILDLAR